MSCKFGHAVRASPTDGITPHPYGGAYGGAYGGGSKIAIVMGIREWTISCYFSPPRQK